MKYNSDNELTDYCFTIDPIDGTINFAHGIPLWGIQVACIKKKKTCAAVIYLPKLNELYYADENGAFLNGNSISVNHCDIKQGLYSVEGPGKSPVKMLDSFKMQQTSFHCRDFACAAVTFAFVACGRFSAANFVWDTLWDYVPGQFIVKQAGGVIYNDTKIHIAANSESFLKVMKENSSINHDEEIILKSKR